jgi:DNA-binding XRE family transcriptional regulator
LFEALEYLFYDLHLPLYRIFTYWYDQDRFSHNQSLFYNWYRYLKLCEGEQNIDYYPERFITTYNETLERKGLDPVIYTVDEMYIAEYFSRQGSRFRFDGAFPCDQKGNPIMKWIGIRAKNIGKITCNCEKSQKGNLTIEITPTSVIHLLNVYNRSDDEEDTWYQIYAGPLCMEFDFPMLKRRRKMLNMTQQEVADAIGATVRTYQKWENGETTPDGHFLLRLMNWLDIPDAQSVVSYTDI